MKPLARNIYFLLIFEILVLMSGYILLARINADLHFSEIIILSVFFMFIAILTLVIFFRGQGKDPAGRTMHTLVSISSKFLIELIFAFLWFFLAKKTGLSSVILFFILYLAFTLFSVIVILKTLKHTSL